MNRGGAVLPEVLTAFVLGTMIVCGILLLTRTQTRLAARIVDQARHADNLRTAELVLSAETRRISYVRDVYAVAGDSLSLRVFRGMGIVCAADAGTTFVRYRGVRLPDATKDSVLLVDSDRTFSVAGASEATRPCGNLHGESVIGLRGPSPAIPIGTVLLLFESGSYYIAGRALRYRRGREGRQPITEEILDAGSGFQPRTGGETGGVVAIVTAGTAHFSNKTRVDIRFPVMSP